MAQAQITTIPPNISIPPALKLFMDGFTIQSEREAVRLFKQAVESVACNINITDKNLRDGYNLFRTIMPQDEIELLWCAQLVFSHLLGLHCLSLAHPRDKRIGLKLLKTSDDTVSRIYKKRNGSLLNAANAKD